VVIVTERITDEELALLTEPADPPGAYEAVVVRKLRAAAPSAVASIVDLAQNAANEGTRLKAAQYIVDRVLGKIPDAVQGAAGGKKEGWEQIIDSVLVEPAHKARAAGQAIERRRAD
jgi:hypothetical protein